MKSAKQKAVIQQEAMPCCGNTIKRTTVEGGEYEVSGEQVIGDSFYESLGFGKANIRTNLPFAATETARYSHLIKHTFIGNSLEKVEIDFCPLIYHLRLLEIQLGILLNESGNSDPKLAALRMQAFELRRMAISIKHEITESLTSESIPFYATNELLKALEQQAAEPETKSSSNSNADPCNDFIPAHTASVAESETANKDFPTQ
jgi:hypothetical protein